MDEVSPTRDTDAATPPAWWATWIAGPDCGATISLDPGSRRWMVGRAPGAAVRTDDDSVALHHAVIEMCPAGAAPGGVTGEVPRVVVLAAPPSSHAEVAAPSTTVLGRSLLALHRSTPPPAIDRPGGVVQRRPRPRRPVPDPPREPAGLSEPSTDQSPTHDAAGAPAGLALISSAVGLVVALAMAVVLRQPMFALFALSGSVVAVAGWVAQRWWQRRTRRRQAEERRAARALHAADLRRHEQALRHHLRAVTPTLARAWHTAVAHDQHLWERRPSDGDALVVGLGLRPDDRTHVAIDLGTHRRIAIRGPHATAVARGIVLQLATQCGPADLRIITVDERATESSADVRGPHDNSFLVPASIDRLPHGVTCSPDDLADLLAHENKPMGNDAGPARQVVIVTSLAGQLGVRTSALRRALDAHPDVSLLCVHHGAPPLSCTSEIATDDEGSWWTPDRSAPTARERALLAGVGAECWNTAIASLHLLVDPEDGESTRRLPELVPASQVMALDADTIARRWRELGDALPRAILGTAHDGLVEIDLVRDGPHALVVGTTGSGKSDLLRTLVLGLAVASPPDRVQFILVDFKGGAAFDACARLPHVVGLVTDLDASGCERVLRSLRAELRRREGILRCVGMSDAGDLHRARLDAALDVPRLVVVVDEFAALADELPHVLDALVDIARRGRSLGVHLVLATQRATGVLSDDIRANTALRIALRLHDHGESRDVVGDDSAARLPRRVAGRAVMRLGDDDRITFQAAHASPVLAAAVDTITAIAHSDGRWPRRRPWCDPLPALVTDAHVADELDGQTDAPSDPSTVVGIVDDTDAQSRRGLRWSPDEGSLLILGGSGSGLSSALRLLAQQLTTADTERPCVVIDAALDEISMHRALGAAALEPSTVLLVDRLDLVRGRLERDDREMHLEMLVHALTRQHSVVVTTASLAAVPSSCLSRCTTRWSTHLHDPLELTGLGLRPDDNPPPVPGRIVIGGTGADAGLSGQLVLANPDPPAGRRVPARHASRAVEAGIALGTDLATGDRVGLCPEPGEHLMVSGGRRSGRTSALAALACAWARAHPDGVVVADERGSGHSRLHMSTVLAERAADTADARPTLLIVDDADAIDDESGELRALLDARHPHLLVAIAVHPGALRGRYGHWTQEVRRHRTGLALLGADDDGDTWGVVLPRRLPLAPAPGRALVIRRGIVDESVGPRIIGVDLARRGRQRPPVGSCADDDDA